MRVGRLRPVTGRGTDLARIGPLERGAWRATLSHGLSSPDRAYVSFLSPDFTFWAGGGGKTGRREGSTGLAQPPVHPQPKHVLVTGC